MMAMISVVGHISGICQRYVSRISAVYQPFISRLSAVERLYIGRMSLCQPYVSSISAVCQPYLISQYAPEPYEILLLANQRFCANFQPRRYHACVDYTVAVHGPSEG